MEERDTVQCSHCAEDILRAAVKCKHCGERVDQPAPKAIERVSVSAAQPRRAPPAERRPKKDKPGRILGIVLVLAGTGTMLSLASSAAPERQATAYGLAVTFLFAGPIAWNIGNALRRYAMPSGVLTSGFIGSVRSRLFWTYGPQFKGLLAAFLLLAYFEGEVIKPGAPGGGTEPAAVAGAEVKAAPAEPAEVPSPEALNAVATSEYDLVGVSPISECSSDQVKAELQEQLEQTMGFAPGRSTSGDWWEIEGMTTIGPATNGHRCHAFLNKGFQDQPATSSPINYVTRYEDAVLTVEKSFGD